MKILLLGVFDFGSTDVGKKLALERLGHRVVAHPYRSVPVEEVFPQGEPFDLVLLSKGTPLTRAQLAHLASLGRRAHLWWPDPFDNWNEELTAALRTGAWSLSATSRVVLDRILLTVGSEHTLRACVMLEGADCEGPLLEMIPVEPKRALLHFGHLSPRRRDLIERLRAEGIAVRVVECPTFGPALQRLVCQHAAVLGINTSPDLFSNRAQTVLAMGGHLLQEDAPDLLAHFPGTKALHVWRTESDLPALARRVIHAAGQGPVMPRVEHASLLHQAHGWESAMSLAIRFATATGVPA